MHSMPKNRLFLGLLLVLSIPSACNFIIGDTKDVAGIKFDQYLEILKVSDNCLDDKPPIYTKKKIQRFMNWEQPKIP